MPRPLRILYVTAHVLGDAGANAADIFPRLAASHPDVAQTIVADFPQNKEHVLGQQRAEFLRLAPGRGLLRHAFRIARKAAQNRTDVIHIFYRQRNAVLAMLIRLFLIGFGAPARVLMDHRSVNLAPGWRGRLKRTLNLCMQPFVHTLAGNPLAVETNHPAVFRPRHIIDLGYDTLPDIAPRARPPQAPVNLWFVGSLKPRNRKSGFLIDLFRALEGHRGRPIRVHVAGPARPDQIDALRALPNVTYYGELPRATLYALMLAHPGIGLAYMNAEFHAAAPSLKFAEYAAFRFHLLASDTPGLRTQGARMGLVGVRYLPEDASMWAQAVAETAARMDGLAPLWAEAERWSYAAIWQRQALPLYQQMAGLSEQEITCTDPGLAQSRQQQNVTIAKVDSHPVHRV